MKLVKFVPAFVATLVLAACFNNQEVAQIQQTQVAVAQATENATQPVKDVVNTGNGTAELKVEKMTDAAKTVVYRCQSGKQVTATYVFQGEEAVAVNLVLQNGKTTQKIPTLNRDAANPDFTSFVSKDYIWNVSTGFTNATVTAETTGMLTQLGKDSDEILAKLCDVDQKATAKINK
ncbi:hypothetical protein ACE4RU_10020 [Actinobacillus seminis]|uniref:hypothetical protein n=1 Tax=Actinobacillus seminis TaxID=722 RepID=UPI003B9223EE